MTVDAPAKAPPPEPALAVSQPLPTVSSVQQSGLPPEAAAQAHWPPPELPGYVKWEVFARFDNFWEGHILGGLLKTEGIPTIVEFLWPGFDLMSYSIVLVPREVVHRARWILAWPAPTEEELAFLATGELAASQSGEGEPK